MTDALRVTLLSILNMVVGLVFQLLLAAYLGTTPAADIFQLGSSIPTLIATALLGVIPIVLVPAIARHQVEHGYALTSRVAGITFALGAISTLVLYAGARLWARLLAVGLDMGTTTAVSQFLEIVSGVPILVALIALAQAHALSHRHYGAPAASAAINGLVLAICTFATARTGPTTSALAWAVVAGYMAQLLSLTRHLGRSFQALDRRGGIGMHGVGTSLSVLLVASLFYKAQPVIERILSTRFGIGAAASLGYASKLAQAATMVAAFGLLTVSLPKISQSLARGDLQEARFTVRRAWTVCIAIGSLTVGLTLAAPSGLIRLLFGRGALSFEGEALTHVLYMGYAPWIFASAVAAPLVAVYYAARRHLLVAAIGTVGMCLGAVSSLMLSLIVGPVGIVLGSGVGAVFTLLMFAMGLPRFLPGWAWRPLIPESCRIAAVAIAALIVTLLVRGLVGVGLPDRGDYIALLAYVGLPSVLVVGLSVAGWWLLRSQLFESLGLSREARGHIVP